MIPVSADAPKGAIFSEDRLYRYTLYRKWETLADHPRQGPVVFILLNPSVANEMLNDPTIRRCMGFGNKWGFCEMYVMNLFAFCATKPKDLFLANDPIGVDNDKWLREIHNRGGFMVAAWGRHGEYRGRDKVVMKMLTNLHQIGEAEYPRHPLYLKGDLLPQVVR